MSDYNAEDFLKDYSDGNHEAVAERLNELFQLQARIAKAEELLKKSLSGDYTPNEGYKYVWEALDVLTSDNEVS